MTFPLYYLLYGFGAFLVVWAGFAFVSIYHVLRFGYRTFTFFLASFIFIAVSVLLFDTSYASIKKIDWSVEVSIPLGFTGPSNDALME